MLMKPFFLFTNYFNPSMINRWVIDRYIKITVLRALDGRGLKGRYGCFKRSVSAVCPYLVSAQDTV